MTKFELKPYNRNTKDSDLLTDLKLVASKLSKKTASMEEYNERGRFHSSTLIRHFGNWFKVLELAGLEMSRSQLNIPEESLFQNLQEVWIKLGKQPTYTEMQRPLSRYSAGTYENRFGSWRNALEKFVSYINNSETIPRLKTENIRNAVKISKHRTKRSINWRLRFLTMRHDGFKCKICGRSPATDSNIVLHVDHIKPWVDGGESVLENLQTLCSKCNVGKSDLSLSKSEL